MTRQASQLELGGRFSDNARLAGVFLALRHWRGRTLLMLIALLAAAGLLAARQDMPEDPAETGGAAPPVAVTQETALHVGGGLYLSRVSVANPGGSDLRRLRVEGVITDDSGRTERSSVRFEHVPGHSRLAGDLFFTIDPARHPPRLGVRREAS